MYVKHSYLICIQYLLVICHTLISQFFPDEHKTQKLLYRLVCESSYGKNFYSFINCMLRKLFTFRESFKFLPVGRILSNLIAFNSLITEGNLVNSSTSLKILRNRIF